MVRKNCNRGPGNKTACYFKMPVIIFVEKFGKTFDIPGARQRLKNLKAKTRIPCENGTRDQSP